MKTVPPRLASRGGLHRLLCIETNSSDQYSGSLAAFNNAMAAGTGQPDLPTEATPVGNRFAIGLARLPQEPLIPHPARSKTEATVPANSSAQSIQLVSKASCDGNWICHLLQ